MALDVSSAAVGTVERVTPPAVLRLEQTVTASGTTVWIRVGRPHRMLQHDLYALTDADRRRFRRLADQWREETFFSSSTTSNLSHPAYLKIMAMGEKALPLILSELQESGGHWFMALRHIVDEDEYPDKPSDVGKIRELKEAWLAWGRQNDYL